MRRGVIVVGASVLVVGMVVALFVGHGPRSSPEHVALLARGSQLYQERCAGCHGVQREGGSAPSLQGVARRYSLRKIERIAVRGKGRRKATPMPAGSANPEEARAIARWLAAQP